MALVSSSTEQNLLSDGCPPVEKRTPVAVSLEEVSEARSRTEDQLNRVLANLENLPVFTVPVKRANVEISQPQPNQVRERVSLSVREPLRQVASVQTPAIVFGSEELRAALLGGGERVQNVKCPKCQSNNVRRANVGALYETCARLLFMSPYRCRKCLSRFHGKASAETKISQRPQHAMAPQEGLSASA